MIGRAKPTPAQFFGWADFSTSFFFLLYTSITTLLYFYIPEQVVMVRKSVLTLKYIWKKKKSKIWPSTCFLHSKNVWLEGGQIVRIQPMCKHTTNRNLFKQNKKEEAFLTNLVVSQLQQDQWYSMVSQPRPGLSPAHGTHSSHLLLGHLSAGSKQYVHDLLQNTDFHFTFLTVLVLMLDNYISFLFCFAPFLVDRYFFLIFFSQFEWHD